MSLTCQHTGYSQSRSNPSKSYLLIKSVTWSTNFCRAEGLLTNLEYLSPCESFQPPIANVTLIPFDFSATTFS